jgi:hypothetical protein
VFSTRFDPKDRIRQNTEEDRIRQNTEEDRRQKTESEVRSEVLVYMVLSLFVVTKCYSYSKIVLQLTVVPPGEYPVVTVTFRVLSLFVVTKCYSYSKTGSVIINCSSAW